MSFYKKGFLYKYNFSDDSDFIEIIDIKETSNGSMIRGVGYAKGLSHTWYVHEDALKGYNEIGPKNDFPEFFL